MRLNFLRSGIVESKIEILFSFVFLGRASIYILRTAFGVDWSERIKIIYAGDDDTDEDAMMVIYQREHSLSWQNLKSISNIRHCKAWQLHSELLHHK